MEMQRIEKGGPPPLPMQGRLFIVYRELLIASLLIEPPISIHSPGRVISLIRASL